MLTPALPPKRQVLPLSEFVSDTSSPLHLRMAFDSAISLATVFNATLPSASLSPRNPSLPLLKEIAAPTMIL
jgi:hypothetical protein